MLLSVKHAIHNDTPHTADGSDLHQIHRVLGVPLKEVRGEVSIRGARSPVTTGIPSHHRMALLVKRLQLRSKVSFSAACGRRGRTRQGHEAESVLV